LIPHEDQLGYYYTPLHDDPITNSLALVEKGSVNNYDFTLGTALGKKVNVGLTLSVTIFITNFLHVIRKNLKMERMPVSIFSI